MRNRLLMLIFVISIYPICISCIWDRDTLAQEAKGNLSVLHTLVGWSDRYPDQYYEMRLDRVRKELIRQPNDLNLYDDAAVALDRLHQSDEAIGLMREKKKRINLLEHGEEKDEHEYRYLANLGTFYAHRWIAREREERESDYSDLTKAEELITAAIELNPDAHFGREKYQLIAIRWLNSERRGAEERALKLSEKMRGKNASDAIEGLTGMIGLGAAWRSVDIHAALADILLYQEYGSLALLGALRLEELMEDGASTLYDDPESMHESYQNRISVLENEEPVRRWYIGARKVTDTRNTLRLVYMQEKLGKGEHPDTHPNFWNEWKEMELPSLPDDRDPDNKESMVMQAGILAVCALLAIAILLGWWLKRVNLKSAERIPFAIR